MQEISLPILSEAINNIICNYKVSMLKVLDELKIEYKFDEKNVEKYLNEALKTNNVNLLEFLDEKQMQFTISKDFILKAINKHSVVIIRYLIDHNIEVPSNVNYIETICMSGHIDILGLWAISPFSCIYDPLILDKLYHGKFPNIIKTLGWWVENTEKAPRIIGRRIALVDRIRPNKIFGELGAAAEIPLLNIIAGYSIFFVEIITSVADPAFQEFHEFLLGSNEVQYPK